MPLTFPTLGMLHKPWGGPPGPRPTPSSALARWHHPDSIGEERVQGDPRGPGGPPHNLCSIPNVGKTKWHWAQAGSGTLNRILTACEACATMVTTIFHSFLARGCVLQLA